MKDIIILVQRIWSTFWGNDVIYQLMFILALLIVYRCEKDIWRRRIFLWYPLFVCVLLLNPISVKIESFVWGDILAYYCRQLSLIPVFFVIAYAVVVVISDKLQGNRKMIAVLLCIIAVMAVSNSIYKQTWIVNAENMLKVPDDVIEICDAIHVENENATIAVPLDIVNYIRQYDASIHLLYGRGSDEELAAQVSGEQLNVEYVMQTCCSRGANYVVVPKTDRVCDDFATKGYMPWMEVKDYLVYKCQGYDGVIYKYNDLEQLSEIHLYNKDGNARIHDAGYSIAKYTHYASGRVQTVFFYNKEEQMVTLTSGYAGVEYKYNADGKISEEIYLDMDGNPVDTIEGYARIIYIYDENGTVADKQYYDANGSLLEGRYKVTQYASVTNSNSLIYTITDWEGHLIIVDGGWEQDADQMLKIIKDNGGKVDAWIITHPHPDHVGCFNVIYESGLVPIDTIYTIPMNYAMYKNRAQYWDGFEFYEKFRDLTTGADNIVYLREGDTFEVMGLDFEVLHSFDREQMKTVGDVCNDGSLIFRVDAENTSMLFLGDVGVWQSPDVLSSHKDRLKVDYVQMGHHGNGGMSEEVYQVISPEVAFFDAPQWLMEDETRDAPRKRELMESLGAEIYSYQTAPNYVILE